MNVNGSVTPVIFGLRNTTESIGVTIDITRLMINCLTETAIDLAKFGDIDGGITKGIVFRKVDGEFRNVFNAKTNADLVHIMYDFTVESANNPQQGQNGFVGRLTFAGQNKIGVTIRVEPGEDVQLIVQDDLTQLNQFEVIVEGHEVID